MRGTQMTQLPAPLPRVVDARDALGGAVERSPPRPGGGRLADRRAHPAALKRAAPCRLATSSPSTRARPRRGRSCSIATGRPVASAAREFPQVYPEPGHVTHDPEAIWSSQIEAARAAIASAGATAADIAAIGLTNQRETTVVWERATGRPVADAIVWQSRITAPFCEELRARGLEPLDPGADRPADRRLLQRPEDPPHPALGARAHGARRTRRARLRHRRQLPAVAADRRPGPRDRRLERQPDDVLRHPAPGLGRRAPGGDGDPARRAARGPLVVRGVRPDRARALRGADPDRRGRRRPAGGDIRPGLLRAGRRPRTPTGPVRSCCSSRARADRLATAAC